MKEEVNEKLPQLQFTADDVYNASVEYFEGDTLAASVFRDKYALRDNKVLSQSGVDNPAAFVESTPDEMHNRIAHELARIDKNYENGKSFSEYREAIDKFKYVVPQGSPMYGIGNPFVNVSLSNCVVVESPKDSVSGIFDTGKQMANLFKARCGVGVSLDTLRPESAYVNNSAGSSTGAWSFAEYFSNVGRMIGQNGRRAAEMLTMSVLHPDIDKFIIMKRDLSKVTGANISVMLTDEFMESVEKSENFYARFPIEDTPENIMSEGGEWVVMEPDLSKNRPIQSKRWVSSNPKSKKCLVEFNAADLWRLINESAVMSAEPGLIFWDNYKKNLPADFYPNFKSQCVNPCSEIALSPLDSCRLTSTNLKGFVVNKFTTEAYFDFVKFEEMVRLGQRIMDNIVDLEIECLENIKEKCKDDKDEFELWSGLQNAAIRGRRTGFGMHALADTLACLGLRYDSDEALEMVRKISESFRDTAYDESVNLAIERGAFPDFDWELEKDCEFIKRLPQKIQDRIKKYGRRNISLLTVAPTGSTSIVCRTSSGLEPVFSNYFTRRKKINPSDPIHRVDFTDQNGDKWQEYAVFHYNVQDYLNTNSVAMAQWKEIEANTPPAQWSEKINEIIPDYFVTAPDIDGSRRVEIQGIITSYIDHGISSTINLPKGTTVEQVEKLYMLAWKHGLKGVTVYVDGSRSGVLVNFSESKDPTTEIVESKCPKRPKELPCDIHHIKVDGIDWVAFVGLLNGVPYEIFGGAKEQVDIPKKIKQGKIAKRKCEKVNAKGRTACYDLIVGEDDDEWKIKDVAVSFENGNYAAQTRMISLSLRHGVPAQFVAEQLSRDFESDFHSFSRVMARVLKQYVSDGATGSEKCSSCGDKLRFENGCASCPNCGSSKCN